MQRKIFKISIRTVLSFIMAVFFCIAAGAQASSRVGSSAARNIVWEKKLYRQVEFLSDTLCQGRATGTRGSIEAAFWIEREFRDAGLMKFNGTFTKRIYAGQGQLGRNVVGFIPGSSKVPRDRYVIVGAHFDHIGRDLKDDTCLLSVGRATINLGAFLAVTASEEKCYRCREF